MSCLVLAALWSPAEKGLTSWSFCEVCFLVFVIFPYGALAQVWYLTVSIPCLLLYIYNHRVRNKYTIITYLQMPQIEEYIKHSVTKTLTQTRTK